MEWKNAFEDWNDFLSAWGYGTPDSASFTKLTVTGSLFLVTRDPGAFIPSNALLWKLGTLFQFLLLVCKGLEVVVKRTLFLGSEGLSIVLEHIGVTLGDLFTLLGCHILKQGGWTNAMIFQKKVVVWYINMCSYLEMLSYSLWSHVPSQCVSVWVQWEVCLMEVCAWNQCESRQRGSLRFLPTLRHYDNRVQTT